MATLPYWNNGEVISSDKLNSMVRAILDGAPTDIRVSNLTKKDLNQIVDYLSSLYTTSKTNLNSSTSTSDLDTAYTNMMNLVSNKTGFYTNDDTVDLYSTGIRASIITFLQAYDNMMSNDRLNNKNTDNTLGSRIDSEAQTRANNDNAINAIISSILANGGGRNLLIGTGTASGDVASGGGTFVKGAFNGYDAVKTNGAFSERNINMKSALGRTNAKAGDWFTLSVYVKADKQINTGSLNIYRVLGSVDATTNDGKLNEIPMQDKPITTQWQQYSWSFQINDISLQRQNTRVEYNQDTGDNWIYWAGWMLEKGMIAHDWQPSPDDGESKPTAFISVSEPSVPNTNDIWLVDDGNKNITAIKKWNGTSWDKYQGSEGINIIKYNGDISGNGASGQTATFARSNLQPSDIAKVGDIVFDQFSNDNGIDIGFWRITALSSTSCTVIGLSTGFTIPKGPQGLPGGER